MPPADARPTDDPQAADPLASPRAADSQPVPRAGDSDAPVAGAQREASAAAEAPGTAADAGTAPESAAAGSPRTPWRGWDPVIRVAGVVISVLAAFLSGAFEVLLSRLRAGDLTTVWHGEPIGSGSGPLLWVSVLLAVAGNLGIAWFAVSTTGRRWAFGPPWALWTLLMLFAAGVRTHEGDYLLGGDDWVALMMILAGSLSFAIYAYRTILKGIPRP